MRITISDIRIESTTTRSDSGAAAVEFALVALALTMLLLGTIQFGLTLNQWLQMQHAAREGVRWASLRNPGSDVKARAIAAAPGLGLTADDIDVVPSDPSALGVTANTPATVTIELDITVYAPMMSTFLGGRTLVAEAVQRIE